MERLPSALAVKISGYCSENDKNNWLVALSNSGKKSKHVSLTSAITNDQQKIWLAQLDILHQFQALLKKEAVELKNKETLVENDTTPPIEPAPDAGTENKEPYVTKATRTTVRKQYQDFLATSDPIAVIIPKFLTHLTHDSAKAYPRDPNYFKVLTLNMLLEIIMEQFVSQKETISLSTPPRQDLTNYEKAVIFLCEQGAQGSIISTSALHNLIFKRRYALTNKLLQNHGTKLKQTFPTLLDEVCFRFSTPELRSAVLFEILFYMPTTHSLLKIKNKAGFNQLELLSKGKIPYIIIFMAVGAWEYPFVDPEEKNYSFMTHYLIAMLASSQQHCSQNKLNYENALMETRGRLELSRRISIFFTRYAVKSDPSFLSALNESKSEQNTLWVICRQIEMHLTEQIYSLNLYKPLRFFCYGVNTDECLSLLLFMRAYLVKYLLTHEAEQNIEQNKSEMVLKPQNLPRVTL